MWRARAHREVRGDVAPVAIGDRAACLWQADGASSLYDARGDAWSALADPFASSYVRAGAVIAAAGEHLVVWGGISKPGWSSRDGRHAATGARLGDDGAWRELATAGAPSQRSGAAHAWTGHELLVWGGWKDGKPARGGAAYDPAADAWRRMPARATAARRDAAMWTGRELWLWDAAAGARAGHAYDRASDRWRDLAALPEGELSACGVARCGDGAIVVARRGIRGDDTYGCVVWRYDARADAWTAGAPPPPVSAFDLAVIDAGGRVVLAIADRVFEYAAAADAWSELPAHGVGHDARLVWLAGELVAFGRAATRSLAIATPATRAAVRSAPASELPHDLAAPPPMPAFARGPAVTAVAVAGDVVLAGHLDGSVRRLAGAGAPTTVRAADRRRVVGLAIHAGTWTCLAGDHLEIRALRGSAKPTRVALDAAGTALAHRGDRLVVAGDGTLAVFAWTAGTWRLARTAAATGATQHLALAGDTVARTVAARAVAARAKTRTARATVELRGATTLAIRAELAPPHGAATAAVPTSDGGAYVGGFGDHVKRYARGKKRPVGELREYLTALAISDDGRWLAGLGSSDVTAFALGSPDRGELALRLFDAAEFVALRALAPPPAHWSAAQTSKAGAVPEDLAFAATALALAPDGATLAIGTAGGAVYVVDRARLGVTAYPPAGAPVVVQPARSEVIGRDGPDAAGVTASVSAAVAAVPDGREGVIGWRRWRLPGEPGRFVDLGEHSDAAELVVLPSGALAARRRNELVMWTPDGVTRTAYGGHGDDLAGMAVPDGDHVVVWDRQGVVRRWRVTPLTP